MRDGGHSERMHFVASYFSLTRRTSNASPGAPRRQDRRARWSDVFEALFVHGTDPLLDAIVFDLLTMHHKGRSAYPIGSARDRM